MKKSLKKGVGGIVELGVSVKMNRLVVYGELIDEREDLFMLGEIDALLSIGTYVEALRLIMSRGYRLDIVCVWEGTVVKPDWGKMMNTVPDIGLPYAMAMFKKPYFPLRFKSTGKWENAPIVRFNLPDPDEYNNAMRAFYNEIGSGIVVMKRKRTQN